MENLKAPGLKNLKKVSKEFKEKNNGKGKGKGPKDTDKDKDRVNRLEAIIKLAITPLENYKFNGWKDEEDLIGQLKEAIE